MADLEYQLRRYGTGALMVTLTDPVREIRRRLAHQVRNHLLAADPPGLTDVVSGLESLLVEFDPRTVAVEAMEERVQRVLDEWREGEVLGVPARVIRVPLVVSAQESPDLAEVAAQLGLGEDDVVRAIVDSEFTISLLAAAMAPMMNGLRLPAPVERQATPRTDVPPGSVMIAGDNAIIQPFPGPSGWKVVGRTPLAVVDIEREPPVCFAPGDVVRFHLVDAEEARPLEGALMGGAQ